MAYIFQRAAVDAGGFGGAGLVLLDREQRTAEAASARHAVTNDHADDRGPAIAITM